MARVTIGPVARPGPTSGFVRKVPGEGSEIKKSVGPRTPGVVPPPIGGKQPPPPPAENGATADAVETLVASFRLLAPADRKRALALMSLEVQRGSTGEVREVDLWAEAVQEALERTLGPSDGAAYGPQVVRRLLAPSATWAPVEEFLANAGLTDLRPAELLAVFRLLATLLLRRCREIAQHAGIPLTAKLVAQNVPHLPAIFDSAFPGYLASGLAGAVVRRAAGRTDPLAFAQRPG